MIKFFGIRHHGVGSTKRLQKALDNYQPDILVIEGVMEADALIAYIREDVSQFTPPVAMLIYDANNFANAAYYPFVEYSPEWQAMLYAAKHNTPIAHFDLPLHQSLALKEIMPEVEKSPALLQLEAQAAEAAQAANETQGAENIEESTEGAPNSLSQKETTPKEIDSFYYDPMHYMAKLAGFEETEHWWDTMFEQHEDDQLFESVGEVMAEIRMHLGKDNERPIDLYREAYMRQQLRKIEKEGYQKIAVVCGAYHVPALNLKKYTIKDDQQLLKDIPKTKNNLSATWIPWTFKNLSSYTYGAGVPAPAWYQFLFNNTDDATTHWMANVANLLRKNDVDCSSAHIIEAVKLALYLAQMRNLQRPTLRELNEASVSVLLNGQEEKLKLIINTLEIGNKFGKIPSSVPQVPLQKDIETQIKQLKLSKYQKQDAGFIKATSNNHYGGLDLRQEHDRLQSQFLHRLNLLDIAFGNDRRHYSHNKSTKNEYWYMNWDPIYQLKLIEQSVHGNTLEQAATIATIQRIQQHKKLTQLTERLTEILKANLPTAFAAVLQQMEQLSAIQTDVLDLMGMIPNLVQTARYGDVRKTDTSLVEKLILETVPRICVLFPSSCVGLNEESAIGLAKKIQPFHSALMLYQNTALNESWWQVLQLLASESHPAHAHIKGLCTRLLFDSDRLGAKETSMLMQFALSKGQALQEAAPWIEGFLYNSGLFLLHNDELWNILHEWLDLLDKETFIQILPILRRAFSKFTKSEKHKMLHKGINAKLTPKTQVQNYHKYFIQTRMDILTPVLNKVLKTQKVVEQSTENA